MRQLLSKLIGIILILAIAFLALIEVYPEQMKQAEEKIGISVVTETQDIIAELKENVNKARNKDYQR